MAEFPFHSSFKQGKVSKLHEMWKKIPSNNVYENQPVGAEFPFNSSFKQRKGSKLHEIWKKIPSKTAFMRTELQEKVAYCNFKI